MFWFVYKINSENFWVQPQTPLQQHWHCNIVTICPFKLSRYYTLGDSHNVALKYHKVLKILGACRQAPLF